MILLLFLALVFFLNTQLSPYFLDPWNGRDLQLRREGNDRAADGAPFGVLLHKTAFGRRTFAIATGRKPPASPTPTSSATG